MLLSVIGAFTPRTKDAERAVRKTVAVTRWVDVIVQQSRVWDYAGRLFVRVAGKGVA
jgi:hypothetical protein